MEKRAGGHGGRLPPPASARVGENDGGPALSL